MFVPLLTGLVLLALVLTVKIQDGNRVQAKRDVDTLLAELAAPDLWRTSEVKSAEQRLLLASTSAQALQRARAWYPEARVAIDATLKQMAHWVARTGTFPQWRLRGGWDEQVFFLAHAGKVLAINQLITGDDTYAGELGWAGNHLGSRIVRARYKHLPSRPDEPYFRPADNAAALHTLKLYDRATGSQLYAATFKDWNQYTTEELYYAESRLPCAAFSTTNTCQLEPSASATGMYIAYHAAAQGNVDNDIPYREWLHYFKGALNTPFTLNIRQDMREGQQTRFCNMGTLPLQCGQYEREIALWAAAEYNGDYTYFRLFSGVLLQRWVSGDIDYRRLSAAKRVEALQGVAFRLLGEAL